MPVCDLLNRTPERERCHDSVPLDSQELENARKAVSLLLGQIPWQLGLVHTFGLQRPLLMTERRV